MSRTDYQRLIDRGRKAGLGTSELYAAMGSRRPEASDHPGQSDGNGFVYGYGTTGERMTFHQVSRQPLS
jgi:hypothetical protein